MLQIKHIGSICRFVGEDGEIAVLQDGRPADYNPSTLDPQTGQYNGYGFATERSATRGLAALNKAIEEKECPPVKTLSRKEQPKESPTPNLEPSTSQETQASPKRAKKAKKSKTT